MTVATRQCVVDPAALRSVERVFRRAVVETRDARAWHAILRALGNHKVPRDYGLPGQPDKKTRLKAREGAGTDETPSSSESRESDSKAS